MTTALVLLATGCSSKKENKEEKKSGKSKETEMATEIKNETSDDSSDHEEVTDTTTTEAETYSMPEVVPVSWEEFLAENQDDSTIGYSGRTYPVFGEWLEHQTLDYLLAQDDPAYYENMIRGYFDTEYLKQIYNECLSDETYKPVNVKLLTYDHFELSSLPPEKEEDYRRDLDWDVQGRINYDDITLITLLWQPVELTNSLGVKTVNTISSECLIEGYEYHSVYNSQIDGTNPRFILTDEADYYCHAVVLNGETWYMYSYIFPGEVDFDKLYFNTELEIETTDVPITDSRAIPYLISEDNKSALISMKDYQLKDSGPLDRVYLKDVEKIELQEEETYRSAGNGVEVLSSKTFTTAAGNTYTLAVTENHHKTKRSDYYMLDCSLNKVGDVFLSDADSIQIELNTTQAIYDDKVIKLTCDPINHERDSEYYSFSSDYRLLNCEVQISSGDWRVEDLDEYSASILREGKVNLVFTVDGETFEIPLFR